MMGLGKDKSVVADDSNTDDEYIAAKKEWDKIYSDWQEQDLGCEKRADGKFYIRYKMLHPAKVKGEITDIVLVPTFVAVKHSLDVLRTTKDQTEAGFAITASVLGASITEMKEMDTNDFTAISALLPQGAALKKTI